MVEEKEKREEERRRKEVRGEGVKKKEKPENKRTIEVKRIVKEQIIWDKEEKVAKFKEETKKLVAQRFYKQIHIFRKKVSERIPTMKM